MKFIILQPFKYFKICNEKEALYLHFFIGSIGDLQRYVSSGVQQGDSVVHTCVCIHSLSGSFPL